ncbi:hypothetical protein FHY34_003758 [Xanthomonas arboricola]|nr:hypothetical protein [Xanthomonas arboricola]
MQAAIGIQFRTEQTDGAGAAAAAVAQRATGLCIQDTGGDQIACQGHARAAQTHIALLRAEHTALVEVTGCTHTHFIARHRGPAQAHLARAVDLQIATLRRQGAATYHADTGFGRNQTNTVGIHAAQLRHVDADRRCRAIGARHHVQQHAVIIDPPCTRGSDQFPGPDRALHAELTRQQVQAIHVRRIQTVAADTQRTAGDAEAVQRTIAAQVGRAGGQGHARGVEKPAAIAGNAVGVGDHQLRLGTGDFGVPLQAAARRGDLVEDQRGGTAALQIVVAGDIAAQLGLGDLRAVVEDQPVRADVEIAVAVMRDAARIGRDDVHHRHAIGGDLLTGCLAAGIWRWCHLCPRRKRCPGDRAAQ